MLLANVADTARGLRDSDPALALEAIEQGLLDPGEGLTRQDRSGLLQLRAEILRDLGRLDEALASVREVELLVSPGDSPVVLARALHVRGTVEAERGNVSAALETFHAARRVLAPTSEWGEQARVTMAIGIAHTFIEDYERSRVYYDEALVLARRAGDQELETRLLGNLAVVVAALEGPEAGIRVHEEALALARERGDLRVEAYQLANICSREVQLARHDRADAVCREAIERLEPLGHARILAGTRQSLADLMLARGMQEEALEQYRQSLLDVESTVPTVAVETLARLAELHEHRGDPAVALGYYRRMVDLRERLRDEERMRLVKELEMRYDVEQREREIASLRTDHSMRELQLQRRNWAVVALLSGLGVVAAAGFLVWRAMRARAVLEKRLSAEDPLTGALNRRAFLELAAYEVRRSRRSGKPLSVVMADVDHFKPVNDTHGHFVGDEVLVELVRRLRATLREVDAICRWGGEEFVLLFPDAGGDSAARVAERARMAVARTPVATSAGEMSVTLTLGVAVVGDDFEAAVDAADRALYQGKRAGRDRVVVANGSPDRARLRSDEPGSSGP